MTIDNIIKSLDNFSCADCKNYNMTFGVCENDCHCSEAIETASYLINHFIKLKDVNDESPRRDCNHILLYLESKNPITRYFEVGAFNIDEEGTPTFHYKNKENANVIAWTYLPDEPYFGGAEI